MDYNFLIQKKQKIFIFKKDYFFVLKNYNPYPALEMEMAL